MARAGNGAQGLARLSQLRHGAYGTHVPWGPHRSQRPGLSTASWQKRRGGNGPRGERYDKGRFVNNSSLSRLLQSAWRYVGARPCMSCHDPLLIQVSLKPRDDAPDLPRPDLYSVGAQRCEPDAPRADADTSLYDESTSRARLVRVLRGVCLLWRTRSRRDL